MPLAFLSELILPLPPLSEQRRIADAIGTAMVEADATTRAAVAQRAAIDALPAAILSAAFQGQL